MKSMKFKLITLILVLIQLTFPQANRRDTTIIFKPIKPLLTEQKVIFKNSYGMDIMIASDGFGLGVFYGYHFTDALTGKINFSISEAKDEGEIELYNPFTGELFVPNKVNRFLVFPLLFAVEYRLFKDQIMDNFRPYLSASIGPSLIFSTPYEIEFFNSLKYGKAHYTLGGYIGAGAYFGSEKNRILGVNVRYYIIHYPNGIESVQSVKKKDFGKFSISLSLGAGW